MPEQTKSSVFLLPNDLLSSKKSKLLKLRNPCTRVPSYFLLDNGSQNLYELQGFDEKYRSWFINGSVCSDGCIKLATPYSPVFLILPYLSQAKRNVPLDQLLEDDQCPQMRCLADFVTDLSSVANRIGEASLNVWSYNEKLTLDWLSKKIDKLANMLHETKEQASLTNALASDKDSYRVLAFGILSDCLCEELSEKLKERLNLPQLNAEKQTNDALNHNSVNKKAKIDDSSNSSVSEQVKKTTTKPSAKEKALAKSAKGSKAITSFFTKK